MSAYLMHRVLTLPRQESENHFAIEASGARLSYSTIENELLIHVPQEPSGERSVLSADC